MKEIIRDKKGNIEELRDFPDGETLSEKRERTFKLLRDRIRALHFEDRFEVENWIVDLFRELRSQDKESIKRLKSKIDDAGHFFHDTKVIRVEDLKEIFGEGLSK